MSTQKSLDDVFSQLVRRGLPAEYARRTVQELKEHQDDLIAELRAGGMNESQAMIEAANRLGDPRVLVKKTVREYQSRYWCGRWPLLTFLLGPIPTLILAWATTSLVAFCVIWPLEKLGITGPASTDGIISTGEYVISCVVGVWYLFVLPGFVMLVLSRMARRAAMSMYWIGVVACMLALFVGMVNWGYPNNSPLHPTLVGGKTVPADYFLVMIGPANLLPSAGLSYLVQLGQMLLPLAVAAVVLLRSKQSVLRSGTLVTDGC